MWAALSSHSTVDKTALIFQSPTRLGNAWHSRVYLHYVIPGYPGNVPFIVSDEGYGKNDYIETERPLVVVTAPGPGSGKMATCLSQLYHEHKRGIHAGYAKFETFPIWNIPLKHPVNLAYEAATADLNDVNMIDPFHLEAYGETTVNYNRDIEIFPVLSCPSLSGFMEKIPYKSPTDMASTWREIVSVMTRYADRLLFRKSSDDTMIQWTALSWDPALRMKSVRSKC